MNILEKRVVAIREKLPHHLIWNALGQVTRRARINLLFSQDAKTHKNNMMYELYLRSCELLFPTENKDSGVPVMFDYISLMCIFDAMSKYAKLMVFD